MFLYPEFYNREYCRNHLCFRSALPYLLLRCVELYFALYLFSLLRDNKYEVNIPSCNRFTVT